MGGRQLSIKWSVRVGVNKEVTFALRFEGSEEMSHVGIGEEASGQWESSVQRPQVGT